jgi:hypothetical protein
MSPGGTQFEPGHAMVYMVEEVEVVVVLVVVVIGGAGEHPLGLQSFRGAESQPADAPLLQ